MSKNSSEIEPLVTSSTMMMNNSDTTVSNTSDARSPPERSQTMNDDVTGSASTNSALKFGNTAVSVPIQPSSGEVSKDDVASRTTSSPVQKEGPDGDDLLIPQQRLPRTSSKKSVNFSNNTTTSSGDGTLNTSLRLNKSNSQPDSTLGEQDEEFLSNVQLPDALKQSDLPNFGSGDDGSNVYSPPRAMKSSAANNKRSLKKQEADKRTATLKALASRSRPDRTDIQAMIASVGTPTQSALHQRSPHARSISPHSTHRATELLDLEDGDERKTSRTVKNVIGSFSLTSGSRSMDENDIHAAGQFPAGFQLTADNEIPMPAIGQPGVLDRTPLEDSKKSTQVEAPLAPPKPLSKVYSEATSQKPAVQPPHPPPLSPQPSGAKESLSGSGRHNFGSSNSMLVPTTAKPPLPQVPSSHAGSRSSFGSGDTQGSSKTESEETSMALPKFGRKPSETVESKKSETPPMPPPKPSGPPPRPPKIVTGQTPPDSDTEDEAKRAQKSIREESRAPSESRERTGSDVFPPGPTSGITSPPESVRNMLHPNSALLSDQGSHENLMTPRSKSMTMQKMPSDLVRRRQDEKIATRVNKVLSLIDFGDRDCCSLVDASRILVNAGLTYDETLFVFPELDQNEGALSSDDEFGSKSFASFHHIGRSELLSTDENNKNRRLVIPKELLRDRLTTCIREDITKLQNMDDIDVNEAKQVGASRMVLDSRLRKIRSRHFHADGPFRRALDICTTLTILYFFFASTYFNFFEMRKEPDGFYWSFVGIHVFWILDIVAIVTAPAKDPTTGKVQTEFKAIFGIQKWQFLTTLITSLPIDLMVWQVVGNSTSEAQWRDDKAFSLFDHVWEDDSQLLLLMVFRLIKSFHILRIFNLFEVVNTDIILPSTTTFFFFVKPLIHFIVTSLTAVHLMTLVFFHVNTDASRHSYIATLVYVTSLLTGSGPSVEITNTAEHAVALASCFIFVVVQGIAIGKLSITMFRNDVAANNLAVMRETLAIIRHYGVPKEIQTEILSYQFHALNDDVGKHMANLATLPPQMQREVMLYVKVDAINSIGLFGKSQHECKMMLAGELTCSIAEPDVDIVTIGDVGDEMYTIAHGYANVIIVTGAIVATLSRGDYFGEIALLMESCTRQATVRALTYCDMWCLSKDSFLMVLETYPSLLHAMKGDLEKKNVDTRHLVSIIKEVNVAEKVLNIASGSDDNFSDAEKDENTVMFQGMAVANGHRRSSFDSSKVFSLRSKTQFPSTSSNVLNESGTSSLQREQREIGDFSINSNDPQSQLNSSGRDDQKKTTDSVVAPVLPTDGAQEKHSGGEYSAFSGDSVSNTRAFTEDGNSTMVRSGHDDDDDRVSNFSLDSKKVLPMEAVSGHMFKTQSASTQNTTASRSTQNSNTTRTTTTTSTSKSPNKNTNSITPPSGTPAEVSVNANSGSGGGGSGTVTATVTSTGAALLPSRTERSNTTAPPLAPDGSETYSSYTHASQFTLSTGLGDSESRNPSQLLPEGLPPIHAMSNKTSTLASGSAKLNFTVTTSDYLTDPHEDSKRHPSTFSVDSTKVVPIEVVNNDIAMLAQQRSAGDYRDDFDEGNYRRQATTGVALTEAHLKLLTNQGPVQLEPYNQGERSPSESSSRSGSASGTLGLPGAFNYGGANGPLPSGTLLNNPHSAPAPMYYSAYSSRAAESSRQLSVFSAFGEMRASVYTDEPSAAPTPRHLPRGQLNPFGNRVQATQFRRQSKTFGNMITSGPPSKDSSIDDMTTMQATKPGNIISPTGRNPPTAESSGNDSAGGHSGSRFPDVPAPGALSRDGSLRFKTKAAAARDRSGSGLESRHASIRGFGSFKRGSEAFGVKRRPSVKGIFRAGSKASLTLGGTIGGRRRSTVNVASPLASPLASPRAATRQSTASFGFAAARRRSTRMARESHDGNVFKEMEDNIRKQYEGAFHEYAMENEAKIARLGRQLMELRTIISEVLSNQGQAGQASSEPSSPKLK